MVSKHTAVVTEKVNLAGNNWLIKFEFEEDVDYQAGQYLSLKVTKEGLRRSYSIASYPNGKTLELMVDTGPMGIGSKYILDLAVGDEVEALGPMGRFVLKPALKKVLLVATGSGIVPFRPMVIELLKNRKFLNEVHLCWGMRFGEDLYWLEEFKQLEKKYPNFKFDVVLSRPDERWEGCVGHVNDCLVKHQRSWQGWEAYLCGGQQMVIEVGGLLGRLGIETEDIHFEKFF